MLGETIPGITCLGKRTWADECQKVECDGASQSLPRTAFPTPSGNKSHPAPQPRFPNPESQGLLWEEACGWAWPVGVLLELAENSLSLPSSHGVLRKLPQSFQNLLAPDIWETLKNAANCMREEDRWRTPASSSCHISLDFWFQATETDSDWWTHQRDLWKGYLVDRILDGEAGDSGAGAWPRSDHRGRQVKIR